MSTIRKAIGLVVLGTLFVSAGAVFIEHDRNMKSEAPAVYGTEVRSEGPGNYGPEINLNRNEVPAGFGTEVKAEAPGRYGTEISHSGTD